MDTEHDGPLRLGLLRHPLRQEDCCDGNEDNEDEDDNLSSATGDDDGSVSTTPSLDGDRSVGDGSLNDIMDEGFELQG